MIVTRGLSKKQTDLLERMRSDPDGPWYRPTWDGNARQGCLRTLWSLERRGLVRRLRVGENHEGRVGPGWVLTPQGVES